MCFHESLSSIYFVVLFLRDNQPELQLHYGVVMDGHVRLGESRGLVQKQDSLSPPVNTAEDQSVFPALIQWREPALCWKQAAGVPQR